MTEEQMRIGDFARLAGTNLRTLRYYEELGLIQPTSRSPGGFRYYDAGQISRVTAIKRLQELGLSLKEVADTIGSGGQDPGPALLALVEASIQRQIKLVEQKIEALGGSLRELEESRARLIERCKSCERAFSRENCDPCISDGHEMSEMIRALLV